MDSSDGLEPELDFSPVQKKPCFDFNAKIFIFCQKVESNDTLTLGTPVGICRDQEVCKIRLENGVDDYLCKQIRQIVNAEVDVEPKWHRQCYQDFTNQNKLDRLLSRSNDTNLPLKQYKQRR